MEEENVHNLRHLLFPSLNFAALNTRSFNIGTANPITREKVHCIASIDADILFLCRYYVFHSHWKTDGEF